MAKPGPLEVVHSLDVGEILLAGVPGGLNHMARVEGALLLATVWQSAFDLNSPLLLCIRPFGGNDGAAHPDVEFQGLGVEVEPVTELVFRRKDWPVCFYSAADGF